MNIKQIDIPIPFGNETKILKGQIFGSTENTIPILCLHGYLDNSNSFKPLSEYLCKDKYHMISIDLPGNGWSFHLSNPLLYNFKTFIYSIRVVVKHLNLKDYILMGHSMGCTFSLTYMACFPEETITHLILLDFAFDLSASNDSLSTSWGQSIETILKEASIKRNQNESLADADKKSVELTYETALERLLKRNRHVDEQSARILLERLVKMENNKLEFSRDIGIPIHFPIKYHYSEFMSIRDSVVNNIKVPILFIYAWPFPYGEETFNTVKKIVEDIGEKNKSNHQTIEFVKFEGKHHFHMEFPSKCSDLISIFLENVQPNLLPKL